MCAAEPTPSFSKEAYPHRIPLNHLGSNPGRLVEASKVRAVSKERAARCAMRDGQVELANEPPRAKGVQRFTEFDELGLGRGRCFLCLMVTSARERDQSGRAALLKAAQPLWTVGTVVAKSRAVGLIPRFLALSTSRSRCNIRRRAPTCFLEVLPDFPMRSCGIPENGCRSVGD